MTEAFVYEAHVKEEWVDYNGHMRDAYYALLFSLAVDGVQDAVGLDAAYRQGTRCTMYVVEMHNFYLREVKLHDPLRIESRVLDCDSKRYHLHQTMLHEGRLAATCESLQLHVSQAGTPKAAVFPESILSRLRTRRLGRDETDRIRHRSRRICIGRGNA